MSIVINIDTKQYESQSHRVYPENWNGEDWLPVPPKLESKVQAYWPYLDITLNEEGTEIINIVETERPPEPEPSNTPDPAQIQLAINFMLMSCTTYIDEQALQISSVFAVWPEGVNTNGKYTKGQYIMHNDQLYHIEQDVQPIESQPPDAVGMLAVYRPVDVEHEGTLEDPIPWVYGMNCYAGKYYSYNGNTYKVAVGGDMIPCTWYPDSGIWQWELVTGGTEASVEDDVQY